MKKLILLILAFVLVFAMAACSSGPVPANNTNTDNSSNTIRPEDVSAMSYAEYIAAGEGANVVIEGYVQKYALNRDFHNVSMFIQDENGGSYYAYRAVCSDEQAAKLVEGTHVKVSGKKASWSGEIEIGEGCIFYILEGNKVFDAVDISGKLADLQALEKMMNQKISAKELLVEYSTSSEGKVSAFLYNWDGSGAAGSNNDLYFNISHGGAGFTFCVESDEDPEGSGTYDAVTGLHFGDIIDLEGMLYWYNGPNVHVNRINVVKASKADALKGEGVLTYTQYTECADEAEVTVEGYVQGRTVYDEEQHSFSMFLADADGAYYAYGVNASEEDYDKLTYGTKVKLSGIKIFGNGLPLISKVETMEILEGYYIAMPENITDKIGDNDALYKMTAGKVLLRDLKVAASKAPDSDTEYAFLYNWDGSGKAGENCDVYFTVETAGGKSCTVYVDTDEFPEGSDLYKAVTQLSIGDEINLECFVFWNEDPEFHVQKLSVKK